MDTVIFEVLASAIIPTFTTYYVCRFTRDYLKGVYGLPKPMYRWLPMTVGLAVLPFLYSSLDACVIKLMDQIEIFIRDFAVTDYDSNIFSIVANTGYKFLRFTTANHSHRVLAAAAMWKKFGVSEIADTAYWAFSRLAAQQVNTVPLPKCVDPFRFVPFRSLGHCSAVGEVIRDQYSDTTNDLLNDVSSGYIICHAIYQCICAGGGKLSISAFFDSLIFDGLASAIIPCFICYHSSRITAAILREITSAPPSVCKYGPMVIGLTVLVISYDVIDKAVSHAMDETIRVLY